ncbi:hypothetical protein ROZALSC1DRAFT_25163, partial [Rozella allomycis CSF55]
RTTTAKTSFGNHAVNYVIKPKIEICLITLDAWRRLANEFAATKHAVQLHTRRQLLMNMTLCLILSRNVEYCFWSMREDAPLRPIQSAWCVTTKSPSKRSSLNSLLLLLNDEGQAGHCSDYQSVLFDQDYNAVPEIPPGCYIFHFGMCQSNLNIYFAKRVALLVTLSRTAHIHLRHENNEVPDHLVDITMTVLIDAASMTNLKRELPTMMETHATLLYSFQIAFM